MYLLKEPKSHVLAHNYFCLRDYTSLCIYPKYLDTITCNHTYCMLFIVHNPFPAFIFLSRQCSLVITSADIFKSTQD